MAPSDILAAARFAFTRERAAIESARCMVIGTSGNASHEQLSPVLGNLNAEMRRMDDAEQALVALVEEVILRRRGEWPSAAPSSPSTIPVAGRAPRAGSSP